MRDGWLGQAEAWQLWHHGNDAADTDATHTESLAMFAAALRPGAAVLELGCGQGYDAVHLARRGHQVTAVDFAPRAIEMSRRMAVTAGVPVRFTEWDLSRLPLPWSANGFGGVFSYLSLHYFADQTTRALLAELHRVSQPGGVLHFVARSTEDLLYGKGERLAPNVYRFGGHVRHFFDLDYVRDLVVGWRLEVAEQLTGNYLSRGDRGRFVRVQARKP